MTVSTGTTRTGRLADRGRTMHVLLADDQGHLRLQRLRPWHPMLARLLAARLDRELAEGTSPEASASLAARAIRLTSMEFRRDLATSLQRILVAGGKPPAVPASQAVVAHPPRVPLRRARISQSAALLAELAVQLAEPGPVPVQGVAMVSRLLADGTGPLYRQACRDDLAVIIERATQALTV
jgi:hypothetical protein